MATDLGIKPDSRKIYIYRLYSLITDGGGFVYRKVFTDYATQMSGSVSDHIDRFQNAIRQSFLQGVITRVQYDKLFPDRHPASFVDNFDLTLLAFLVRITCAEETADEELRRRVAELEHFRRFRNEITHIHSTDEYDETKFERFWGRIRSVILQLGTGIPGLEEEIDLLKSAPIDPRREAELQEMILDLRRRAEIAQELSARLDQLELNQRTQFDRLELNQTTQFERLNNEQIQTKDAVEDIREKLDEASNAQEKNQFALMEQLQQIAKNPFLQLPSPGDFVESLGVSQIPTIFHYENRQEFTKKDDRSGLRYVAKYHQMVTKGTVAALEDQDYDDMSRIFGSEWASVAVHLGISEGQIKRIKTSFARNDIPAIIKEVVRIWGDMKKENATIHRFIQAILGCPILCVESGAFEDVIKRHSRTP